MERGAERTHTHMLSRSAARYVCVRRRAMWSLSRAPLLHLCAALSYLAGMRFRALVALAMPFAAACESRDEPQDDGCQAARLVYEGALNEALAAAPPCKSDADCVAMRDQASCEGRVEIDLCELAVHRETVRSFDRDAVSRQMCKAAADSEFGCSIIASCAAHGPSVCRAGECVFEPF